eukprot:COSAG06_NODE_149_length_22026_cov_33.454782_17_plen_182_part_00
MTRRRPRVASGAAGDRRCGSSQCCCTAAHSASAIAVERPTTTAHSDASWQHCSQTTGACLATMVPSLPGGHRRTASSAAVRWLWQQRCPHRTAARPLALPSSVGALCALLRYPQRRGRTGAASGQRQSQRRLRAAPAARWRRPPAALTQNRERIGAQARRPAPRPPRAPRIKLPITPSISK